MRNARDRKLPEVGTGEIVTIITMVIDTTMIGVVEINDTRKGTPKLKNKVELTVVEVAKTVTEVA